MSLSVQGVLHAKFDTQDVSASFKKRDFVLIIAENPQYPQYVSFQLSQDKCALLDNYQLGSQVEVHFNLRGRAWVNPQGETKYFNQLEAWKLDVVSGQTTPAPVTATPQTPPTDLNGTGSDDLPF